MKAGLSKDDIVAIAKRKGQFFASLRWRDDRLRSKCRQLVKEGKLVGGRKILHGGFYFYPMKEQEQCPTD